MKIAVTYEDGKVFQHFGHTAAFKLYEAQDGHALSSEIVQTNGSGHGALACLLEGLGVNVLICGGIGAGARFALEDADIQIFAGVSGDADEAVESFLSGDLSTHAAPTCSHHHHDHGHSCGCGHHHHHDHECHEHHHDHECHEHHHDHECGEHHHHDHKCDEHHHHDHECDEHHHHDHECGCGHHHHD